jgi:hypothetical protein
VNEFPKDIYTEPEPDFDTLANLGPLIGIAGIWTSALGLDVNPKPAGLEEQVFIERIEPQPIDAQTNPRPTPPRWPLTTYAAVRNCGLYCGHAVDQVAGAGDCSSASIMAAVASMSARRSRLNCWK